MDKLLPLIAANDTRDKLRSFAGVVYIGIGRKETAGKISDDWVFRVYVKEKKPLHALLPTERIPKEIDGFKTDVITATEQEAACSDNRIKPGDRVERFMPNLIQEGGTLGCFVQKGARKFLLTNHHVVMTSGNYSRDVYVPRRSTFLQSPCNSPIGRMVSNSPADAMYPEIQMVFRGDFALGGKSCEVDAALIELNSGTGFVNQNSDFTIAPQVRDLLSLPFTQGQIPNSQPDLSDGHIYQQNNANEPFIYVKKKGMTTGFTEGEIIELAREKKIENNYVMIWQMKIRPFEAMAGGVERKAFQYDETYEIPDGHIPTRAQILTAFTGKRVQATPEAGTNRIRFHGRCFLRPGDSGSTCLDSDNKIVGLLNEANGVYITPLNGTQVFVPDGDGLACFIIPVFQALGLNPADAVVPVSSGSQGQLMEIPATVLSAPDGQEIMRNRIAELETLFLNSTNGLQLNEETGKHFNECLQLIRHRKRLSTLTWQRCNGPGFVAAIIRFLRGDDEFIPHKIGNTTRSQLIGKMREALYLEGSEPLKQFLDTHGNRLEQVLISCSTYSDITDALSNTPSNITAS
ncbi:MAG: hypothetical protein MUC87_09020 [Bacteroidia bacterium]|jgi:hypothetical protein|nr:hypothetical protein [Bacteroidia bacterium]